VLSEPEEQVGSPKAVHLASVFKFYEVNHGPSIRGLAQAQRPAALCLEFMQKSTDTPLPVVADFTMLRQHAFMCWLRDRGLTVKTISTYQSMIKAALNYAATPRLIVDSRGIEREGQMLEHKWTVFDSEDYVSKITGLPMPQPVKFLPTDDELARFIDAIGHEHIFRYVILALNLWARPEAIMDLDVQKQVDFEKGLIDLNPPGRRQNKKVRPTIRLTENLKGWLLHWNLAKPIVRRGEIVKEINAKTFEAIAAKAGVPDLTRYTLRRYMATRVRRLPDGVRPPREERSTWMGHTDPVFRTTEKFYEVFDPCYLINVAQATDQIMLILDQKCSRSLFSPDQRPSSGLALVKSPLVNNALTHQKGRMK